MPLDFAGPALRLSPDQILAAANAVSLNVTLVETVYSVETGGRGGFLPDTRPIILFEAHKFHEHTAGRFDTSDPSISSPVWNRALYSHTQTGEYDRLSVALGLDRQAALLSASWGLFQIMGENFAACDFSNVDAFVTAMVLSEAGQLSAFLAFIRHEGMLPSLASCDWAGFARRYNGPGYAQNRYDSRLADAYAHACLQTPPPALPSAAGEVRHSSSALNVRIGAGVAFGIAVGSPLRQGEAVQVLSRSTSGWAQISFVHGAGSLTGWVNSSYLT